MATTTVTASTATNTAPLIHAGVNVINITNQVFGGRTVGDTILAHRIPTGVDVIAVYGKITTAETAANATIGIVGNNTLFGSLASGTTPVFAGSGADKTRISLSDDASPRYTYITIAPSSGTWTISATIDLTVLYVAK